jgi:hypothetical protein
MRFQGAVQRPDRENTLVDLDDPHIFEPEYIESRWALPQEALRQRLALQGYTIQPYCYRWQHRLASCTS